MILALLFACADDVSKDKAQATVTEPPPAPAAASSAPAVPTGTALAVDVAHSSVHALGAKITATHDITFPAFDGKVRVDGENVAGLEVTVQVGSLVVEPEKLANHLKTPDFFDVGQFPTATFASTSVAPLPDHEGATHTVEGDLTLHGVTKRVSFPARLEVGPAEVKGHAEFAIDRKDFGIVFPGKPDDLIQDKVVLTIDLTAPRAP